MGVFILYVVLVGGDSCYCRGLGFWLWEWVDCSVFGILCMGV